MSLTLQQAAPESSPRSKGTDRRGELRYPCPHTAELRSLDDLGRSQKATVLDVSQSGLRVQAGVHHPKGARVEVVIHKHAIIFGEVRYCRTFGEGFHLGIRIDRVFYARDLQADHIEDEQLRLYVEGDGLAAGEVLALVQHIRLCSPCRARLDAMFSSKQGSAAKAPFRADTAKP